MKVFVLLEEYDDNEDSITKIISVHTSKPKLPKNKMGPFGSYTRTYKIVKRDLLP